MASELSFEVVVPYCVVDGEEYTLLTERELARRKVGMEALREEAADYDEDFFRQWELLPPTGKVTEAQLNRARDQYAQMTSKTFRAELKNHEMVSDAAKAGEVEIVPATYKLKEPTEEALAEAKQAALSPKGLVDQGLYFVTLAKKLLISHDRKDKPVNEGAKALPVAVLRKLGQAADERGNLDENALAFVLRSRRLSATESPSGMSS